MTVLEEADPLDTKGESGGARTGGLSFVPNSWIFKSPMINYTLRMPFVWCTLPYTFTYETDWRAAETIVVEALGGVKEIAATAERAERDLKRMGSEFAIKAESTEPVVRTWAAADGVELKARCMVHPRRRASVIDAVNRLVMDGVQAAGNVDFAYRTVRTVSKELDQLRSSSLSLGEH